MAYHEMALSIRMGLAADVAWDPATHGRWDPRLEDGPTTAIGKVEGDEEGQ
jgi:hypothetical protein